MTSSPFIGNSGQLVDQLVGSAYPTVRHVADHIEHIKHVSAHMAEIFRVSGSIQAIDTLVESIASIDLIEQKADDIESVISNMSAISGIYTNLANILSVQAKLGDIAAILEVADELAAGASTLITFEARLAATESNLSGNATAITNLATSINNALALKADASALFSALSGKADTASMVSALGTKADSSTVAALLASRTYMNLIANAQFNIAERFPIPSVGSGGSEYTLDMWRVSTQSGITCSSSVGTLPPGNSTGSLTCGRFAFGGTGASGSNVSQRIESVSKYAGKTITAGFFIADTVATSGVLKLRQCFGTGGSPSANVDVNVPITGISTSFGTYYLFKIDLPSIADKTIGTNGDDYLEMMIIPTATNAHVLTLGNVMLTPGDVTNGEAMPFTPADPQQDRAKCQRYFQWVNLDVVTAPGANTQFTYSIPFKTTMRATPSVGQLSANPSGTAYNLNNASQNLVFVNKDGVAISLVALTNGYVQVSGYRFPMNAGL